MLISYPSSRAPSFLYKGVAQMNPGGRLVLFCMSDANEDPWVGPERLTEEELRALFQVGLGICLSLR